MSTKAKRILLVVICFAGFMTVEQLSKEHLYYSYLTSTTHTEDKRLSRPTELSFAVWIERPFTRWIPFFKYGETVHVHSYKKGDPTKAVFERIATTRTRLFVVGFCSTAKYEQLADKPFEKVHDDYLHEYKKPNQMVISLHR